MKDHSLTSSGRAIPLADRTARPRANDSAIRMTREEVELLTRHYLAEINLTEEEWYFYGQIGSSGSRLRAYGLKRIQEFRAAEAIAPERLSQLESEILLARTQCPPDEEHFDEAVKIFRQAEKFAFKAIGLAGARGSVAHPLNADSGNGKTTKSPP